MDSPLYPKYPPREPEQQPEPVEQQPEAAQPPSYENDWPQEGGFDGPQPWDLVAQGFKVGATEQGTTLVKDGEITELAPGEPDTVSPIVPAHGRPVLSSLSAGEAVKELGALLAELGYETSISKGRNPFGVLDETVASAVERFREDYDVAEDPSQFAHDRKAAALSHVGPWTWEALLRAAARKREERGEDRRQLEFA
jgi:hypothetical protein